jgi:hypothetical protein
MKTEQLYIPRGDRPDILLSVLTGTPLPSFSGCGESSGKEGTSDGKEGTSDGKEGTKDTSDLSSNIDTYMTVRNPML